MCSVQFQLARLGLLLSPLRHPRPAAPVKGVDLDHWDGRFGFVGAGGMEMEMMNLVGHQAPPDLISLRCAVVRADTPVEAAGLFLPPPCATAPPRSCMEQQQGAAARARLWLPGWRPSLLLWHQT